MNDQTPIAGIGDNSGKMGVNVPPVESYREFLHGDLSEARERLMDLRVGLARLPETVDANNAPLVIDFIAQCKKALRQAEDGRKKRKEPVLSLGKAVDEVFKGMTAPVASVLADAEKRLNVFRVAEQARVDAERAAAAKAAREAQDEADRIAREKREAADAAARAAENDEARAAAVRAQEEAADAEAAAKATEKATAKAEKPTKANLTGEYGGSTAYGKKGWDFEVENLSAVPTAFLVLDEKAVREHIKEAKDAGETPAIPGIRFTETNKTIVKG